MKELRLLILTPVETLLETGPLQRVLVQLADDAPLAIYPGHAPLIAETVTAPVRYTDEEGAQHLMEVEAGVLRILEGEVSLFTPGFVGREVTVADEGAQTFERLARALLESLRAQPEPRLENHAAG